MKSTPHPVYLKAAKGEYIGYADLAKLIRSIIGAKFDGTTFGVRTKTYAGGGSIHIQWADGPTVQQVEAVAGQFQTRHFDGMIDMAHYSDLWLYPDGSAHMAHDQGTEGSRGSHPEVIKSPKSGDAVLLSNVAGAYVFFSRNVGPKAVLAAIAEIRGQNYAELDGLDWGTITVEVGPHFGAHVKGADSIRFSSASGWLSHEIQYRAQQIAYPETLPDADQEPPAQDHAPCLCW